MPYVWGGGHTETAWLVDSGYDCSGFVSMVLHSAGYLSGPDTTQTLPDSAGILSGPGKYVTIYDRTVNTMNFAKPKATKASTAALALKQETQGVHMTGKSNRHSVSIRVSPAVQRAIQAAAIAKGNAADNTINDEHVVIDLDGQWWESGGDSQDGGAEMVHRITDIGQSYLKSFNLVLHPAGL
jgi:NlpC/P60 family